MSVTPVLKKLEHFFVTQQSIAFSLLQDGISRAEIDEIKKALNLSFPPEVYELFEWKNGMRDLSKITIGASLLFRWGAMVPFDQFIEVYHASQKAKSYPNHYFPIFTNGGGDYILVNCNKDDAFYGYLYWHSPALYGTELDARYTSLSTLLECVLECFEAGGYYFESGIFEEDSDLSDPILDKYELQEEE
ncbi:SMI1/KNR4 family protein [Chitinophaga ginsengisoli]|uniref:Cell wall assembly regulator SMI1 n=1 Tax=Chitinophaga ginsengisoli TaxID=363837 RepID=A0A2P8FDU7_9BACT|nr:SMI1/KNR4 family protein [Chitinophaga ginsengisoli]PSL19891.1 cell wall assembly regulator SMI1 [Chitinophaga ginsengisoli]